MQSGEENLSSTGRAARGWPCSEGRSCREQDGDLLICNLQVAAGAPSRELRKNRSPWRSVHFHVFSLPSSSPPPQPVGTPRSPIQLLNLYSLSAGGICIICFPQLGRAHCVRALPVSDSGQHFSTAFCLPPLHCLGSPGSLCQFCEGYRSSARGIPVSCLLPQLQAHPKRETVNWCLWSASPPQSPAAESCRSAPPNQPPWMPAWFSCCPLWFMPAQPARKGKVVKIVPDLQSEGSKK